MNGWMDRTQADTHAQGQALRHAGGRASRQADRHARMRARMRRKCGKRRTSAQLQRERVDRDACTFAIEIDATIDCVPEAPGGVSRV